MIYIVKENQSNFNAAVKAGDHQATSDIITDQLSKLIAENPDDIVALLKENGHPVVSISYEAIAKALAVALSKSEKVRKQVAILIAINDKSNFSNLTANETKNLENLLKDPKTQNTIQQLAGSIFNLFAKDKEKSTKATQEVVDKTKAQAKPSKKDYTPYYVGGAIVLTIGILSTIYYFVFVAPGKKSGKASV